MVPRPDIVALPVALTPTAAMEQVLAASVHALSGLRRGVRQRARRPARAPALRARCRTELPRAPTCEALLYPAHFVPETKRLGHLLAEIRREKGAHGDRGRRVRLGRRARDARGPARGDRRRDRRRVRSRGRADPAPGPGSLPGRGQPPVEEFNERFDRASRRRTTTRSAASSSASSAARPRSATASRSATSSSTSPTVDGTRILHADATLLPVPARDEDDDDGDDS